MKLRVVIELDLIDGPEQDYDTVLDAFAGTIGRDNAAPHPLRIEAVAIYDAPKSTYEVRLVDEA